MDFLAIGIKLLQLVGLFCAILAAYWIPTGNYNNFIQIFSTSRAAQVPWRGGLFRQEGGIITIFGMGKNPKAYRLRSALMLSHGTPFSLVSFASLSSLSASSSRISSSGIRSISRDSTLRDNSLRSSLVTLISS